MSIWRYWRSIDCLWCPRWPAVCCHTYMQETHRDFTTDMPDTSYSLCGNTYSGYTSKRLSQHHDNTDDMSLSWLHSLFLPKRGGIQLYSQIRSMHSQIRSCTVRYTVVQSDTQLYSQICSWKIRYAVVQSDYQLHSWMHSWIHSCTVFYYLGSQLHGNQSIQYCACGEISATAYLFVQLCIMTWQLHTRYETLILLMQ